jgi:hypothetical protein
MLGAMNFWDRDRGLGLVILLVLLLILGSPTHAIAVPTTMMVAGAGNGGRPEISPMERRVLPTPVSDPVSRDRVEDSVFLQSLRRVFHTIQDQPDGDQAIASTYQTEECFRFLQLAFVQADLDLRTVLSQSSEVSFFRNGDLIKLDNSVYRGLPHWGIYWDGYVLHNWDGFHREPSGVFLVEFAQPGSVFHIFHPSFPHSCGSRLVIPK